MNQLLKHDLDAPPKPILPSWIFDHRTTDCLEDAAFSSGAALSLLHVLLNDPNSGVPIDLLWNRLALRAAANGSKIEGRGVTEPELRDAYLLTVPGDAMGPDGDMLAFWRAGAGILLRHAGWQARLQALLPEDMQEYLLDWSARAEEAGRSPFAKSVSILTNMLQTFPRREAVALLCADVILARSLGWARPLPLFGLYVNRKTLRAGSEGEDVRVACHIAIAHAAQDATRLAHDLARRAAQLRVVAPKLRSKGSDEAVQLFLSEDAVLPSTMLSPTIRGSHTPMTARSARRLCERLIELGVVRELTGRATFRLYGVA
jgi:plasmid stability protein